MKIKTFILTFLLMSCPFLFGQSHWNDPNLGGQESMTICATIALDGSIQSGTYEVAVFHNQTLLEVGEIILAPNGTLYHVDLNIVGDNSMKNIYFKFFDGTNEYVSLTKVDFNADGIGLHTAPLAIEFKSVAKIGDVVYSTLQDALAAATENQTITLFSDIKSDDIITINKAITLNGNNKTLTSTAGRAINVDCAGEVTIQNLTVKASGERAFNVIQKAGTLNINNVIATAANYTVNVASSAGAATVNVTGSDLTGLNIVNIAGAGAYVTVDNTKLTCDDQNDGEGYAALTLNKDATGATIAATNVTFDIKGDSKKAKNGAVNGTITIDGNSDEVAIVVAIIVYDNGTYYSFEDLNSAVAKAQAGETITLIRDVTTANPVTINKSITLDGKGKTLTYTSTNRAIEMPSDDNAKLNVTIKNLAVAFSGNYCERGINYNDNGTLALENVTVNAAGKNVTYAINLPGSSDNAEVFINNSSLTGNIALNVWGENATITATDSDFISVDKTTAENYAAIKLNNNSSTVAEGTVITVTGGSIIAKDQNNDPSIAVSNATATGRCDITNRTDNTQDNYTEVIGKIESPVAIVTYEGQSSFYACATLQNAINKAIETNGAVKLLTDVTYSEIITVNGAVVIDGNGKTLKSTAARAINVSGANGVTIKNLTINASGERAINVINGATNVTIDNVTATAANYTVNLAGSAANAVVTINNSNLTGLNVVNVAAAGAKVTVIGGTLTCNDQTSVESYAALAIATNASKATITATGVTFDIKGDSSKAGNGTTDGTITIDGVVVGQRVAMIQYANGTAYTFDNLAAAVAKAEAGETVVLLADVTIDELVKIEKAITLDLNRKKVTSTAQKAFEVYANATIKNGTINGVNRCVDTRKAVELTLTDVTLVADNYTSAYGNPQPLTIGGSENGTKVNMTNVNISAKAGYGIITFVKTNLTATNSTIGGYSALYVKPGSDNSSFSFVNSTLSGSNANNDVEGNSFSTIALRANKVIVNVDAISTINSAGNYHHALSLGGKFADEETTSGNNVTIAGNINGNIVSSECINANTVKVKAKYADELFKDGFVTGKVDANGLVKVEGTKVAKIGDTYYASLKAAISAATSGKTVVLLQSVTENVTISSKNLTIDGGDNNYTGHILVEGSYQTTDVVVKNINFINGTGTNYAIKTNSVKKITVENCTVNNYYGFLYANSTTTTVVVKNVTVDGCEYGMHYVYGTSATLENVKMTNVKNGLLIQNYASKTITVKNSNITSIAIWERDGKSGVQTFKFEGNNTVATLSTSQYAKYELVESTATLTAPEGSTVTTPIDGHVVKYIDGVYKVVPAVAKLVKANEIFGSIQEAIDAAQNDETVVVLQDVTINVNDEAMSTLPALPDYTNYPSCFVVTGKNITIDLAGKTITANVTTTKNFMAIFSAGNGGNLTLKDSTTEAKVKMIVADNAKVYSLITNIDATSNITIKAGNYICNQIVGWGQSLIYDAQGRMLIEGGNFYLGNVGTGTNGLPWIFNTYGNNEKATTVTGGTFNADINHQYWAFEVNISETLALKDNGNNTWTVVEAEAYVTEISQKFNRKVGYATLAEAIAASKAKKTADDIVTLVKDVVLAETITIPADQTVKLELNGKSINVAKETINCDIYGKLTLEDNVGGGVFTSRNHWVHENAEFIVNSGTVQNIATATGGFPIYLDGGKVTIYGGTVQALNGEAGTSNYGNYAIGGNGTIVMKGGEVKGNWGAINLQAGSVEINDGKLTVTGNIGGHALYVAGNATATINGGEFVPSTECGSYSVVLDSEGSEVIITAGRFRKGQGTVLAKSGKLSIKGGTFDQDVNKYCAKYFAARDNKDGTWTVKPSQKQDLVKGWNWYSSYLDIETKDLTDSIGTNGLEIKGQTTADGSVVFDNAWGMWTGTLAYNNAKMYMINTTEACELDLSANLVDPQDYTITLNTGWNWIGYPSNQIVEINAALANIPTPQEGDIIKTRNSGHAEYAWGMWVGTLKSMIPGEGYMYRNTSGEAKTFKYNVTNTRGTAEANMTSENNYWTPNVAEYPYNMTMTAILDGENNGNFEIAAFVNGEVRGSARPIYVEQLDSYMFFLTVNGNNVEEMTFKCYDLTSGEEYELNNRINYSNDAIVGSVNNPYVFTRGTVGLEEVSSFNIYPNPTTTDREINLATTCDKVEVFNALGVKVAEYQNVDTIDAFETAGIYVIRVTNNGNVKHCRLVVK